MSLLLCIYEKSLTLLIGSEIYWLYQIISRQAVSKKSIGLVIGSTMVVVEKIIWNLRVLMCYEPQKQLKMEKNYIGIITVIVSVQIAINGSTPILNWGYNIKSVPSAKIGENQESTVLGARDTFTLIVMTVSKFNLF